MKFEIILFTAFFFFPFENFGQVDLDIPKRDTIGQLVVVDIKQRDTMPVFFEYYGYLGQLDSCSTTNKTNDIRLFECYNKETQIIKSRILTKTNFSRKWERKVRITTWGENEKKSQKYVIREKYIYFDFKDMAPGMNSNLKEIKSITWYFMKNGKFCLKRKKKTKSIRYHTN